MDAIALLKAQHRLVEDLFELFENTDDTRKKQSLFNQIADNLAAHCTIEEKLFYPSVYVGELQDQLEEAVEEHLAAKRIISDLLGMSPDEEKYDAKMSVLKEEIEHHVEEEEEEMFTKVRQLMPKRELDALGEAMEQLFKIEMKGTPRNAVPGQTGESAPLS